MPGTLPQRWTVFGDCFGSQCCQEEDANCPCECEGVGYEEFETVQEMLQSNPYTSGWRTARCTNFLPGDGTITYWWRLDTDTAIPNGTDILQADDGAILQRTYVREGVDGINMPTPAGATYQVSIPLAFPSITDMRNSVVSAFMVFLQADANGQPGIFYRNSAGVDDGVNCIVNAAGIVYKRAI